jgi:methionyl aminopeptidase
MSVKPLTQDEIKKMRTVCSLAANTLVYIEKFVKPGVSTNELDQIVYDYTRTNNANPACLGYHGYPKTICTSVNNVICHGVPSDYILKDGDIINVDVTSEKDGFFGDTSATFLVGNVLPEKILLVQAALEARDLGIKEVRPNGTVGDIGFAIDKYVTRKGYSAVKEIGGHGIGKKFHQDPFVPSFGKRGKGEVLFPWQCITVEPMVNEGSPDIVEKTIPKSTIKYYETVDAGWSAQFEHTVLVTDTGYEILTLPG